MAGGYTTSTTYTTSSYSTNGSFDDWMSYTPMYYVDEEWVYNPESDSYRNTVTGTVVGHEQIEKFGGRIDNLTKDQIAKDKKLLDEILRKINDRPTFHAIRQQNEIDCKEVLQ